MGWEEGGGWNEVLDVVGGWVSGWVGGTYLVGIGELDVEGGETHKIEVEGVGRLNVAEEGVFGKVVLGPEGVDGGRLGMRWILSELMYTKKDGGDPGGSNEVLDALGGWVGGWGDRGGGRGRGWVGGWVGEVPTWKISSFSPLLSLCQTIKVTRRTAAAFKPSVLGR